MVIAYVKTKRNKFKKLTTKIYKCPQKHCHNKSKKINKVIKGGNELKKKSIQKIYFTHENYDKPYKVVISGKTVEIYKIPKDIYINKGKAKVSYNENDYTELVKKYDTNKIFIGKNTNNKYEKADGNTLLLKINNVNNKNKYVSISSFIREFNTNIDDPIIHYYSTIGPNDTPYPIAESKKNIYFMLDSVYVDKKLFPEDIDFEFIYSDFYMKNIPWYKSAFPKLFKLESSYQKTSKKFKIKLVNKSFYEYDSK